MDPATGTPNAAYPLIGQVVGGRYHIVGLIGEGGMGVVYKAEQRLGSTVRRVAVKTLHSELSRDPSITARFHREVGTVAQLEHPNTVRVYDFGSTDDGTLYIAMEFLDGKALNRVIETEGALDPKRVGHLLRQVVGSLDEAHRQGIVHRDLKPENVLLIERAGEKDVVKLVDFGIAARSTESAEREKEQKLTQQGMVLGTPPYMSPEQFTGRPLDARSDVYSLGIMAYEMLTGQLPFQADTAWQWATHHMTSPPRSFDETPAGGRIPDALRRTVLKALSKEPGDRQSSAGQFYTEFVASLGSVSSIAAPKGPPPVGKTEAMPQAAPFAMAPTEGMAIPEPLARPATAAIPSPSAAIPSPVALPPAPQREAPASNRGLIYGLSGLGAVLLVAMGIVALRSDGGSDAPPLDVGSPAASSAAAGGSPSSAAGAPDEPAATAEPEPEPEPAAREPEPSKPTSANRPASAKPAPSAPSSRPSQPTGSTPSPAPSSTPAPTAPAQTPAQPTPAPAAPTTQPTAPTAPSTPTPKPPSQPTPPVAQPNPAPAPSAPAADGCAVCAKAAANRDIVGAGQAYAQCSNPAGRQQCTQRVAQVAPKLAETAAFNQQCGQARAIIAAASQMGVPPAKLAKANAAAASCK
jgi:eukaryotic-like serine/threonine-protein kinase